MRGKRGLIMGVANDHSIAWGIARRFTSMAPNSRSAIKAMPSASASRRSLKALAPRSFCLATSRIVPRWMRCSRRSKHNGGSLDFVVHSLAYSDRAELKGRYADTTRDNFVRSMVISAFSFTEIAKRATALMQPGGALLTLTFAGANRVMPNYNVMGVAKAALEASVRYLAADYGPQGIRVNAISAGLIRTLAGAGISDGRVLFTFQKAHSPLRRGLELADLGGAALYLLSSLSSGVTGEIHHVDAGFNIVLMPHPDSLKSEPAPR